MTQRFVWQGINKDVRAWARCCLVCQQSEVDRHTRAPFGSFTSPSDRLDKVHMDILRPWLPSNESTYIVTCVDRFTRCPEALPIPDIRSETISNAFIAGWVSRSGIPSTITTGRRCQFNRLSSVTCWHFWARLASHDGITPHYQWVRRTFSPLPQDLAQSAAGSHPPSTSLPLVLRSLRATLK